MKNKFLCLFLETIVLLSMPLLNSCNITKDPNIIDGEGENSRIVGEYEFNSSKEYLGFYETFKKYNAERFLSPINFNDNSFKYYFRTEGIKYKDFYSKRYDINFDFMNMYFEIEVNQSKIKFETFELKDKEIFKGQHLISYDFNDISIDEIEVYYLINDFVIAKSSSITKNLVDNFDFIKKLNDITFSFIEGSKYVF